MNRDLVRVLDALRDGEEGAREALIELTYDDLIQWGSHLRRRLSDCPLMEVEDLAAKVYVKLKAKPIWDFNSISHFRSWAMVQMDRAFKDAYRREFCDKRGGNWHHMSLEDAFSGEV